MRGESVWLVGGSFLLLVIPYTVVVIFPTNKRLESQDLDIHSDEAARLLRQWRTDMPASEVQAVHVTRRLNASPERVFQTWSMRPFSNVGWHQLLRLDARVGGHFRVEIQKQEKCMW
jgi:hypothetical protein